MKITCYNSRGETHDFHPGEAIPPGWYNSPDKAKSRGVVAAPLPAAPLPAQKKDEPVKAKEDAPSLEDHDWSVDPKAKQDHQKDKRLK